MSKSEEPEEGKMRELDDAQTDVIVDDYKDMKIDMLSSSREQRLGWNKYAFDSVTGFNEYD